MKRNVWAVPCKNALRAFPRAVEEVWGKASADDLQGPMAAVLLDLDFPKTASGDPGEFDFLPAPLV